jgi:hypothetical protein
VSEAPDTPSEGVKYVRLPWPLVAGGLLGVLAVALAIGLFANRYLRPQVGVDATSIAISAPTTPTIAPAAPTVQVPVAPATAPPSTQTPVVGFPPTSTSASSTSPPATPVPVTAVATPRPTVNPQIAAEVADAYQYYWQVRAEALLDLDTSRLDQVMAGDHLASAEELVAQLRSESRAIQTDVNHNYAVIQGGPTEALIIDEYTDNSIYVDITSHQTLTQSVHATVREQYRMNKIEGSWRVVSLVRAQ